MKIVVYGDPVPKGRPKVRVMGRFAQIYTPKKTRDAEDSFIAQAIKSKPSTPLEGPLSVSISFFKLKPKSYSKKIIHWDKRPDLDNLIKLTLDAMNKIFYQDDAQIVELCCNKAFSDKPRTEVIIRKL